MPPVAKPKARPTSAKASGGSKPRSSSKKKAAARKKKKVSKKPDDGIAAEDDDEDEEEDLETDVVFACPVCGLGSGTSVPQGCPFPDVCRGTMYVCKVEDGGGRCGGVCWHSHPNDTIQGDLTFFTTYWCRQCHDVCNGRHGCSVCAPGEDLGCPNDDAEEQLWTNFGRPV